MTSPRIRIRRSRASPRPKKRSSVPAECSARRPSNIRGLCGLRLTVGLVVDLVIGGVAFHRLDAVQRIGFALIGLAGGGDLAVGGDQIEPVFAGRALLEDELAAIYPPERRSALVAEASPQPSRRQKLAHQFRWRSAAYPRRPGPRRPCLALQPGQPRLLIHPRHQAVAGLPPRGRLPWVPQQTQVKSSGPRGPESQVGKPTKGRCRSKSAICCDSALDGKSGG
jgi:hypothetical protein